MRPATLSFSISLSLSVYHSFKLAGLSYKQGYARHPSITRTRPPSQSGREPGPRARPGWSSSSGLYTGGNGLHL